MYYVRQSVVLAQDSNNSTLQGQILHSIFRAVVYAHLLQKLSCPDTIQNICICVHTYSQQSNIALSTNQSLQYACGAVLNQVQSFQAGWGNAYTTDLVCEGEIETAS